MFQGWKQMSLLYCHKMFYVNAKANQTHIHALCWTSNAQSLWLWHWWYKTMLLFCGGCLLHGRRTQATQSSRCFRGFRSLILSTLQIPIHGACSPQSVCPGSLIFRGMLQKCPGHISCCCDMTWGTLLQMGKPQVLHLQTRTLGISVGDLPGRDL